MQWKPDVTVAAIIKKNKRFLLVEENADGLIVFNQPAGHLEKNESLLDAVRREVLEETAWHFNPDGITGVYQYVSPANGLSYLRFCFHGTCERHEAERSLDDGIIRTAWLSLDEISSRSSDMRSPLVELCILDYLNGRSWPLDLLNSELIKGSRA